MILLTVDCTAVCTNFVVVMRMYWSISVVASVLVRNRVAGDSDQITQTAT